jgi:hypothetical protein
MNTTHNTKTKRLIAALGVAPAALFASSGTAHAYDCYDGPLAFSYYCSPAGGGLDPRENLPQWPNTWDFQPAPREQFLPNLSESPPYPQDSCGYMLQDRCDN